MSWKKVVIPGGAGEALMASRLQDEFEAVWMAAGAPPEAVMYGGTGVRQENDHYFTPAAVDLAGALLDRYGAVVCNEPDISTLAVLVKNSGSAVRR